LVECSLLKALNHINDFDSKLNKLVDKY